MGKVWRKLILAVLIAPAGLAGCQTAPEVLSGPVVPLPAYTVGDRFTYDDGRSEEVVAVHGDWVDWRRSNGFTWTGHRDFIMPSRDWQSATRTGHLEKLTVPQGAIWPLQTGRSVRFTYASKTVWKDGSDEKTFAYKWRCHVQDWQSVTVPAGAFETIPVSCRRYSGRTGTYYGERIWYYAPRVGHYILYTDESRSRGMRKRALTSYHLKLPDLSASQSAFYNANLQTALQTVRSKKTHTADGEGMHVAITPIRTFRGAAGVFCREYRRTIEMAGRDYHAQATSCRMNDGKWHHQRPSNS